MPDRIKVLDDATAEMIAAGEVITRPLAVVKELVENSLDAEGRRIKVSLREGGRSLISVLDDGHGMSPDDATLALKRHATSKISGTPDLSAITTLGFRGEALPSIAAVSRMELITRAREAFGGRRLVLEGGELVESEEAGAAVGTRITVRDLFYNTPARRKHLSSPKTEIGRISLFLKHMSIAFPEVSFELLHNGRRLFKTPGSGRVQDVLSVHYDADTVRQMLILGVERGELRLNGIISRPSLTRSSERMQALFVNGRNVRTPLLGRVVREAYRTLLPRDNKPAAFLILNMDPAGIDVNMHPRKTEIRFYDEDRIHAFLLDAMVDRLKQGGLIQKVSTKGTRGRARVRDDSDQLPLNGQDGAERDGGQLPGPMVKGEDGERTASTGPPGEVVQGEETAQHEAPRGPAGPAAGKVGEPTAAGDPEGSGGGADTPGHDDGVGETGIPDAPSKQPDPTPGSLEGAGEDVSQPSLFDADSGYSIVGQAFCSYILLECDRVLYILDQHAAQERIIYEKLLLEARQASVTPQNLLVPLTMKLDPEEHVLFMDHRDLLCRAGIEVDDFGENTLLVRSLPAYVRSDQDRQFIRDLADLLLERGEMNENALLSNIIIIASCRSAVKAGHRLSDPEIRSIVEGLRTTESPHTCPHGRPTIIELEAIELEKEFKRR